MAAKYILAVLSAVFLALSITRLVRGQRAAFIQARTWLLVAVIFGLISGWLFWLEQA